MESTIYTMYKVNGSSLGSQELICNKNLDHITCTYKHFKIKGFPCQHRLTFFQIRQVFWLLDQYIIQRWTRKNKVSGVWNDNGVEINERQNTSLKIRHAKLSQIISIWVVVVGFMDNCMTSEIMWIVK